MQFAAVAADYDGTLATHGEVGPEVIEGLRRFGAAGRKLLLVTGRELNELLEVFPDIGLFDRVVAENGALLYCPRSGERKPLGESPPPEFLQRLRERNVQPLSVGCSIVATVEPNETAVLEAIRDLGLELQVIFNKGAVMVLPAGVNKASGLAAALEDLKLSPRNVAAIGDAENDHALLRMAEFGVAVANALPPLKRDADRTSEHGHGAAVVELMDAILADDLRSWRAVAQGRRPVLLGSRPDGAPVSIGATQRAMLIAGESGSGKSIYAAGILERIAKQGYQYCVVDPEGDYTRLTDGVVLGSSEREPTLDEIETALENPKTNVVANLCGLPVEERPAEFARLCARLAALRAAAGRPHWLLVGEAHRLFPAHAKRALPDPEEIAGSLIYVSVHPESMQPAALDSVDLLVSIGADAHSSIAGYCRALGRSSPPPPRDRRAPGEALAWFPADAQDPFSFRMEQSESERRHRRRRLVETELPEERSFYFRGPKDELNLRAQNLALFLQIGRGVDAATWMHHLRRGDYSRWLQESLRDPRLAAEVAAIERNSSDAESSRAQVRAVMESFLGASSERQKA